VVAAAAGAAACGPSRCRAHHHEDALLDLLLQEALNKLSSLQPQVVLVQACKCMK